MDGIPTATDTATGYDVLNIRDLKQFTSWKAASYGTKYFTIDCGSAKSADAIGISRHNLGTAAASVSVESSANGTDWTERLAAFVPTNDKSILKTFTTASAQYWRVKIVTAAVAPQVAVCLLGVRMTFPYSPDAPYAPVAESIEASTSRGKTGQFLGATIRFKPYTISPRWTNNAILRSFLDDTIAPWWDSHASNLFPFFWAWDITTYPGDVRFVSIPEKYAYKPSFSVLNYVDTFDLEMEGVKE
jgi:hypothetical protein